MGILGEVAVVVVLVVRVASHAGLEAVGAEGFRGGIRHAAQAAFGAVVVAQVVYEAGIEAVAGGDEAPAFELFDVAYGVVLYAELVVLLGVEAL